MDVQISSVEKTTAFAGPWNNNKAEQPSGIVQLRNLFCPLHVIAEGEDNQL